MNFYPIQAILMYLAIWFAPADVDKISIEMPDQQPSIQLVRSGEKWESEGNVLTVELDSLVAFGPNGKEALKISDFIALPGKQDWTKTTKISLGGGNTMEKIAPGFAVRRIAPEGETGGIYQIRYQKPGAVNVLGEVVKPGVHALAAKGNIHDVIASAGGPTASADMKRVSIIRGSAGSVPEVTSVDLIKTEGCSPHIQAGDSIHVLALGNSEEDTSDDKKIAKLADTWLTGIDAGNYARSWNDAASFFQNSITAEAWADALTKVRKPLGALKSRKVRDMKKTDTAPGAPDGKYMIIQFDTSFAAKAESVETLTLSLEKDGSWKATGYFIR